MPAPADEAPRDEHQSRVSAWGAAPLRAFGTCSLHRCRPQCSSKTARTLADKQQCAPGSVGSPTEGAEAELYLSPGQGAATGGPGQRTRLFSPGGCAPAAPPGPQRDRELAGKAGTEAAAPPETHGAGLSDTASDRGLGFAGGPRAAGGPQPGAQEHLCSEPARRPGPRAQRTGPARVRGPGFPQPSRSRKSALPPPRAPPGQARPGRT